MATVPRATITTSVPITTVGQYHLGVRVVTAVARVTPVQISQRRMTGVPRLAIASRRIRSASSLSTSGPMCAGASPLDSTSASWTRIAGRWVPSPGTSQA